MSQLDLVWRGRAGGDSPEPDPSPASLRLITLIRESTWLGRDPDGRSVTARRLAGPSDPADPPDADPADRDGTADAADPAAEQSADMIEHSMIEHSMIERAAVLAAVRAPSLVRARGVQRVNGALWLVSEWDNGVWLSRLLDLTRPTPLQAVVIGLGVLGAVRTVHAAGDAHGSVCADEVLVGGDGQVRLDGWVAAALGGLTQRGSQPLEQRQRADLAAVGVLLARLARMARRSPACADEGAPALLVALDTAAEQALRPGAGIELVAARLEAGCGPEDDAAARSELAALVRAATMSGSGSSFGSGAAVRPQPAAAAGGTAPGAFPGERRAGGLGARLRGLWERTWRWLVALLVLVVVVALEFALLHERLTQDLQLLLGSGRSGSAAPASAGSTPAPLPPVLRPAPASAGAVGGIDLRALEPCLPEAACPVRVLVQLRSPPQPVDQPPPAPRAVQWSFQVIDRCTGSEHSVPGGLVSAAPGDDQLQAVGTVPLPAGHALAVIAVTNEPARAASGPLLVPARPGSCPRN